MTVMVKKVGGSVAVIIPKTVAAEMELSEGTPMDLSTTGGAIVMRKQRGRRVRRPIGKIVGQIKRASYRRRTREMKERGGPIGGEIW